MLPGRHRLRASSDFTAVLRSPRGVRTRSRLVVTHATQTDARTGAPPRVGLVVSKAVGNAVVRNRTKRRLRAAKHNRKAHAQIGAGAVQPLGGAGANSKIARHATTDSGG